MKTLRPERIWHIQNYKEVNVAGTQKPKDKIVGREAGTQFYRRSFQSLDFKLSGQPLKGIKQGNNKI